MGAEDDFRKVAEDVRELARSLRSELRSAKWEAKGAARYARDEIRREYGVYKKAKPYKKADYGHTHYRNGAVRTYGAPPGYRAAPGYTAPSDGQPYGGPGGPMPPGGPVPPWAQPGRPPQPPPPPRPPKASRRRNLPPVRHKRDGSTLISLLLLVVGLAWLATQIHLFAVPLEAVLAVTLALLGAGMVVTARTDWSLSRHAWPVWLGAGLLVVLLAASSGSSLSNRLAAINFGDRTYAPATWAAVGGQFDNNVGPYTIDLSAAVPPADAGDKAIDVHGIVGPVTVILPQPLTYTVHFAVQSAGPVTQPDGTRAARNFTLGSGLRILDVHIHGVLGPVKVQWSDTTASPRPLPTTPSPPQGP